MRFVKTFLGEIEDILTAISFANAYYMTISDDIAKGNIKKWLTCYNAYRSI